jgi:hypothetical protein
MSPTGAPASGRYARRVPLTAALIHRRLQLFGARRPPRTPGNQPSPGFRRAQRCAVEARALDVIAILVRLAARELRDLELPVVLDPARRKHAEGDVRRVEPMVRDRRFRAHHRGWPVHECGRTEGRFARKTRVQERTARFPELMREGGGHLHEEVMRVLAIDEGRLSVGRLPGRQEKRVPARAHERIRTQHRSHRQRIAIRHVAARRTHDHAGCECEFIAARAVLRVVDAIQHDVAGEHPVAVHDVGHLMDCRVGLPEVPEASRDIGYSPSMPEAIEWPACASWATGAALSAASITAIGRN